MSVSGGITPHLITKLIQIFPVVTLNDVFVTLNVTLNQSQIISIVYISEVTGSGWILSPMKSSYQPDGAIAQSEIALKCQRSLFSKKK